MHDPSLVLEVSNFKSIRSQSLPLDRVTVLIGPPAAGKSNLLESLMLLGYALRTVVEHRLGFYPSLDALGRLNRYVRMVNCGDLAARTGPDIGSEASITLRRRDGYSVSVNTSCDESGDTVRVALRLSGAGERPAVEARFNAVLKTGNEALLRLLAASRRDAAALLAMLYSILELGEGREESPVTGVTVHGDSKRLPGSLPSVRLYSFDRFDAGRNIALGATGRTRPPYLAEDASNLGWILYREIGILERVNAVVEELANIEVRPLSDGRLAFFDGVREVGSATASDTVLRLIYIVTALMTARPIGGGPALEPIVMLEDPEAHVYPAAYTHLIDYMRDATRNGYVIVATHSGLLAEMIWEKLGATIYYVARRRGATRFYRVEASEVVYSYGLDELVTMHSSTMVQEMLGKGLIQDVNTVHGGRAEAQP